MSNPAYYFSYRGNGYGPYSTYDEAKEAWGIKNDASKWPYASIREAYIFYGTAVVSERKELLESDLVRVHGEVVPANKKYAWHCTYCGATGVTPKLNILMRCPKCGDYVSFNPADMGISSCHMCNNVFGDVVLFQRHIHGRP